MPRRFLRILKIAGGLSYTLISTASSSGKLDSQTWKNAGTEPFGTGSFDVLIADSSTGSNGAPLFQSVQRTVTGVLYERIEQRLRSAITVKGSLTTSDGAPIAADTPIRAVETDATRGVVSGHGAPRLRGRRPAHGPTRRFSRFPDPDPPAAVPSRTWTSNAHQACFPSASWPAER